MLEFIEAGNAVARLEDFPGFITASLPRVVACDSISYNEVDPERQRLISLLEPPTGRFDGDAELLAAHMGQHPLISYYQRTRDGRAIRISDFLSDAEFRELDIYTRLYSKLNTRYQMSVSLPAPEPLVIGIALNRARRDFTEKDRLLLNLLRPHLEELHHRLQSLERAQQHLSNLRQAIDAAGRGVMMLNSDGRVEFVNQAAQQILEVSVDGAPRKGQRISGPLLAWLSAQQRGLSGGGDGSAPAEPLVIEGSGVGIVCRYLPGVRPEDNDVVLLEEQRATATDGAAPLGLTAREAEVLSLVASGRTNAQIAEDLVISERTVQKHLEHVFRKLRVSTRTAAVALMMEALR
jgi:DNA-binding CsgD family transcriptional regulator/PAS domain-containing protein